MNHKSRINSGMTLLFSLLILSIVLTVSLGVFGILITGIRLSGTTRESQLAFYAADAGVECSLYVDLRGATSFGTTTAPSISDCSNARDLAAIDGSFVNGAKFTIDYDNGSCVDMTVDKSGVQTVITAIGRNTCEAIARRVNRSIEVRY